MHPMPRDGAAAARMAHNHEVPGSSPGPATKIMHSPKGGCFIFVLRLDLSQKGSAYVSEANGEAQLCWALSWSRNQEKDPTER